MCFWEFRNLYLKKGLNRGPKLIFAPLASEEDNPAHRLNSSMRHLKA